MYSTGSSSFPLDFCSHRWLENVEVAERALQILPALKIYIDAAKERKITEPSTNSFKKADAIVHDELFPAKLQFFLMVAREITPFLKLYQTDRPMLPFLCSDLTNVLRGLLEKFIKPSVMVTAGTTVKLLKIDYEAQESHLDVAKLKVGFATERALTEHVKKGGSERLRLEFRLNCKRFLVKMVSKLFEKSPINYSLVRCLSVLDPRVLLRNKDASSQKLTTVLQLLVESSRLDEKCCDDVLREFRQFFDRSLMESSESFQKFDPHSDHLDKFYHDVLANKAEFSHFWEVVRLCLILSHGQASVERGFSVNKEVMVVNLKEHTLIAQRIIHDHVRIIGGLHNIVYSKELFMSASAARKRYHMHLEEEKEKRQKEQKALKRKTLMEEISDIKAKKKRMEDDVKALIKSADSNAEKAEAKGNLYFITKSNGLRRAAKDKQAELETLDQKLNDKIKELKEGL